MKLVIDHLKSASRTVPVHSAVICGEGCLTYAELDALSDQIAAGLQILGVSVGEPVGIYMPKCTEAVAAIYAMLKLAGCYVPIAIDNPLPRVTYMLEDCGIRFLLTATTPTSEVAEVLRRRGAEAIAVPDIVLAHRPTALTARSPAPQDAAAVLYTSGSTGQPKSAVITHANLAVFSAWAVPAFKLGPADRLLSHAPFHFDLSFFDLFAAAAASGAAVLATPSDTASAARMARLANRSGVTVWQSVPSALTLQAMTGQQPAEIMPTVRRVLFAGERMPRQTLLKLPEISPNARFYNVYGCTETNDTFMYEVSADVRLAPDPLPIGKPLPFTSRREGKIELIFFVNAGDPALEITFALLRVLAQHGVATVELCLPFPIRQAAYREVEGFIYLVSRFGRTGQRVSFDAARLDSLASIRAETKKPLAVGFGVKTADDVAALRTTGMDAVIIGSAVAAVVRNALHAPHRITTEFAQLVRQLATPGMAHSGLTPSRDNYARQPAELA